MDVGKNSIVSLNGGIKLKDPSTFRRWSQYIRRYAINRGVWELVDPYPSQDLVDQKKTELPPEPRIPPRPTYQQFLPVSAEGETPTKDEIKEAKSIAKEEQQQWRDDQVFVKEDHAKWERLRKGVNEVIELLYITTEEKHTAKLSSCNSAREMIRYLATYYNRVDSNREEVFSKWCKRGTSGPRRDQDVLEWLDEWEDLRQEIKYYSLESESNHPRKFLMSVKEILPIWWANKHEQIIVGNKGKASIDDLLTSFRATYMEMKRTKPQGRAGSTPPQYSLATSTWQGHNEAKPDDEKKDTKPYRNRPCPCGRKNHPVAECYTLNEAIRPEGWKVLPSQQKTVDTAFKKDPNWKKWVDEKIAAYNDKKIAQDDTDKPQIRKGKESGESSAVALASQLNTGEVEMKYALHGVWSTQTKENLSQTDWALDSASSANVCNDRRRFVEFRHEAGFLKTGDGKTAYEGFGTAVMIGMDPLTGQPRCMKVSECYYSPRFHINLISLSKIMRKGFWWDTRKGCVNTAAGDPLLAVYQHGERDIFLFYQPELQKNAFSSYKNLYGKEWKKAEESVNAVRNSAKPLAAPAATKEVWHRRLGHVYQGAIKMLPELVEGITIKENREEKEPGDLCTVCHLMRAPKQLSRRPIGKHYGRCGRVYFDLIYMQMAWNKHCWITHFYVEGIQFHWAVSHTSKDGCQDAIRAFVAFAIRWLDLPIKVFHSDNERSVNRPIEEMLTEFGFIHTFTVPYSPEMNGPGERSGSLIVQRIRALLFEGNIPWKLWPETLQAAIWLINRTPTRGSNGKWFIPWDEARSFAQGHKPKISLANVKLYGSLAYCRAQKIPDGDKLSPRAQIGYLVGYIASNIWKIWFPRTGEVRHVRDAVFDENRRYSPDTPEINPVEMPQQSEIIPVDREGQSLLQAIHEAVSIQTVSPDDSGIAEDNEPLPVEEEDEPLSGEEDTHSDEGVRDEQDQPEKPDGNQYRFITPPYEDSAADQGVDDEEMAADADREDEAIQRTPDSTILISAGREDVDPTPEPILPLAIDGLSTDNIVEGQRIRKPRRDNDYVYSTESTGHQDENEQIWIEEDTPKTLEAFAAGLTTPMPSDVRHKDDLPPPPKYYKDVWNHPLRDAFIKAMSIEIDGLKSKDTYEEVDLPKDRGVQVLPLMWVYAYKFDKNGFLLKCKARICVRGDLQHVTAEEKRAATLAARTGRMIFALVAGFDLDLRQRDATNAFLNSFLRKPVYTYLPEGMKKKGQGWKLLRALYGLRIAPRLWQKDAAAVLKKLGLEQVAEDPCVFVTQDIIVFFYVDDILIASHKSAAERAQALERELERHWVLTDQGDAEWFLGIRILRDRTIKKLWLVQDTYIASVAERFHLTSKAPVSTPGSATELESNQGIATPEFTHLYQQKIGSVQYATCNTRADAAKMASYLAQFLTNPSQAHMNAADRLIVYLNTSRYRAIAFGPVDDDDKVVRISSDASYGDHADRRSSAGYICSIFGGPVDWKAVKQKTVTKSTTDAELLSLSDTGSMVQWWMRLFGRIGFKPPGNLAIQCDNKRTIDLVTSEDTPFDTNLRHVDIHGHWLRQEVQAGRVHVKWVPSSSMMADGLTKLLPRQRHADFVKLLGMEDVKHLIDEER